MTLPLRRWLRARRDRDGDLATVIHLPIAREHPAREAWIDLLQLPESDPPPRHLHLHVESR